MSRSEEVSNRDQGRSEFTAILEELCDLAHCRAAILVDQEGEAVDYAGQGTPFDLKVLAAEWRLVLQLAHQGLALRTTFEFQINAQKKTYLLRFLPEGYALVMELPAGIQTVSERALSHAIQRLCQEAGFENPAIRQAVWLSVTVEEEATSYRPASFLSNPSESAPTQLEVLGRLDDRQLEANETGYRVRLANGLEGTLVREHLGDWFFEEERWPV